MTVVKPGTTICSTDYNGKRYCGLQCTTHRIVVCRVQQFTLSATDSLPEFTIDPTMVNDVVIRSVPQLTMACTYSLL